MRKRDHLSAWINHAAINAGTAVRCCWHVLLPPQIDHLPHVVKDLALMNPVRGFLVGVGIIKDTGVTK